MQAGNIGGMSSMAQCSQICHCEAPTGPWQSQQHSAGSQGTPGENGTACTRFPRRFAPRNDKSGAIVILMTACSFRQHCAGPGCPLPYNGPHKNHRLPKKQPVYRQHRTIQREHSARDFLSGQGLKSAGILCVFQVFQTDGSAKNIRRRPKLQLCGVAL